MASSIGDLLFLIVPGRHRSRTLLLALLSAIVFSATLGCGGSSGTGLPPSSGTTPGQYLVTVTGTDASTGKLAASTTVTVTVN